MKPTSTDAVRAVNLLAAHEAVAESLKEIIVSEFGSVKQAIKWHNGNASTTYWHQAIHNYEQLAELKKESK